VLNCRHDHGVVNANLKQLVVNGHSSTQFIVSGSKAHLVRVFWGGKNCRLKGITSKEQNGYVHYYCKVGEESNEVLELADSKRELRNRSSRGFHFTANDTEQRSVGYKAYECGKREDLAKENDASELLDEFHHVFIRVIVLSEHLVVQFDLLFDHILLVYCELSDFPVVIFIGLGNLKLINYICVRSVDFCFVTEDVRQNKSLDVVFDLGVDNHCKQENPGGGVALLGKQGVCNGEEVVQACEQELLGVQNLIVVLLEPEVPLIDDDLN
jgi:hypothetical protein